ncbi:uncharacterized protein BJ171DRAFT_182949 [Polychytrium aggregatum]|uniref:uncharacterized protein n=1 Tax=Polychytrium aggregatum TaxID=110093 RepID=UPI0022FEEA67|nr:uncharacterized protein BJ171DRAFT_182949 [Polychytrium aggregatum]KAI9202308.1 hypothetical protein BJ171DRAFT_182949 [Polychytrium aggregatum]
MFRCSLASMVVLLPHLSGRSHRPKSYVQTHVALTAHSSNGPGRPDCGCERDSSLVSQRPANGGGCGRGLASASGESQGERNRVAMEVWRRRESICKSRRWMAVEIKAAE